MRYPLLILVFSGLLACSDESVSPSDDGTNVHNGAGIPDTANSPNALTSNPKPMQPTTSPGTFPLHGTDRVLMIGDSLSVGGFGQSMQDYLVQRFGQKNVAIFAVCGSSPQHWLRSGANYTTKCGYREQTPLTTLLYDFDRGRPPPPVPTPKLEDLLTKYRPTILIVQLGTNWMDGLVADPREEATDARILDEFISVTRSWLSPVGKIVWITPPDSSHYPLLVQRVVLALIKAAAKKYGFEAIDSSAMTHYIPGKSGTDGVHYAAEPAKEWASLVTLQLDHIVRY